MCPICRGLKSSHWHKSCLEDHANHRAIRTLGFRSLPCGTVGWNELVLKWLEMDAAGLAVDFPETGFRWNELGRLARKFYRDCEGIAYPQLLERLNLVKDRIVASVEDRSNAELYERPWYGKWTMGRMIQLNTSSPYENARGRLRKWLKAKGAAGNS